MSEKNDLPALEQDSCPAPNHEGVLEKMFPDLDSNELSTLRSTLVSIRRTHFLLLLNTINLFMAGLLESKGQAGVSLAIYCLLGLRYVHACVTRDNILRLAIALPEPTKRSLPQGNDDG